MVRSKPNLVIDENTVRLAKAAMARIGRLMHAELLTLRKACGLDPGQNVSNAVLIQAANTIDLDLELTDHAALSRSAVAMLIVHLQHDAEGWNCSGEWVEGRWSTESVERFGLHPAMEHCKHCDNRLTKPPANRRAA